MLQQAAGGFPPPLPGFPGQYQMHPAVLESPNQEQGCRRLHSVFQELLP